MASVNNPPGGGSPTVVMTPVAGAQAAAEVRQALERAGWRVIVTPDPYAYIATAKACVVIFSPEIHAKAEISAAISGGFTTLIPVTTTPMPVPFAQWAMPPVPLGLDVAQRQRAAATILQKLAQIAPGMPVTPAAPQSPAAPPVARPPLASIPAPQAAPVMPVATPYNPPPITPSAPIYAPPMPGYPQPSYSQQPYGQLAGYPTHMPKSRFPAWLRNTIIIAVIAAVLIGCYTWASSQHIFYPNALSGQWTMRQTISGGGTSPATLTLTENGTRLTGSMDLSQDGSGSGAVPLTGTFIGQSVTLHGALTDAPSGSLASLTIDLTGTAAGDDQSMQGNGRYALTGTGATDGAVSGTWTAVRATSAAKGGSAPRYTMARTLVAALRHD